MAALRKKKAESMDGSDDSAAAGLRIEPRISGSAVPAEVHGGDHRASAPVKAIELSGESPDRGTRYRPVANGDCVFNRKGGEQPKANE